MTSPRMIPGRRSGHIVDKCEQATIKGEVSLYLSPKHTGHQTYRPLQCSGLLST